MVRIFWLWWAYSFFGYLLEKVFAAATRARLQNRKCFILLPLCPVYGFAVTALLLLPPPWREGWRLAAAAAAVPCAAEYLLHLYYEKLFGVRYWDYRGMPGQLRGRVCLPFAGAWLLLAVFAVKGLAPWLERLIVRLPPEAAFAAWMLLAADFLLSRRLLRRFHDTELLSPAAIRRRLAS